MQIAMILVIALLWALASLWHILDFRKLKKSHMLLQESDAEAFTMILFRLEVMQRIIEEMRPGQFEAVSRELRAERRGARLPGVVRKTYMERLERMKSKRRKRQGGEQIGRQPTDNNPRGDASRAG